MNSQPMAPRPCVRCQRNYAEEGEYAEQGEYYCSWCERELRRWDDEQNDRMAGR